MIPILQQNIDHFNHIDWKMLTREDSFAEGKNFKLQQGIFQKIKKSFELVFKNIHNLSEILPDRALNDIADLISQFIQLKNRINNYSDTNRHQEMTEDIKRTCFNIQENLNKYLEYVNPTDLRDKIKNELDEITRIKNDVDASVKERLKELDQGIEEVSRGKRAISGIEAAKFYEDQAARHRDGAQGNGKKRISRGWLGTRNLFFWLIVLLILSVILLYIMSFLKMDKHEDWKIIWDYRTSVLFVALLTILYAGLYFATKNYDREKDLEYKNKIRANIANTWLMFSAGEEDFIREVVIKEAAKTIFSDIAMVEKKRSSDNGNISINIPQNIGKALNGE